MPQTSTGDWLCFKATIAGFILYFQEWYSIRLDSIGVPEGHIEGNIQTFAFETLTYQPEEHDTTKIAKGGTFVRMNVEHMWSNSIVIGVSCSYKMIIVQSVNICHINSVKKKINSGKIRKFIK